MTYDAAWHNAQNNPDVGVPDDARMPAKAARKRQERTKRLTGSKPQGSVLEHRFLALWESLGCPALEREYRFDEVRRWKADFAHIGSQVLIEIEGLNWRPNRKTGQELSRHQHPKGYEDDCEKYNYATLGGWQVYRLTANMITAEWCLRIADAIVTTEGKP